MIPSTRNKHILKSLIIYSIIAMFFLFSSCSEDIDVRKENIIGSWLISLEIQEFRADTVYQVLNGERDIDFYMDGTGSMQVFTGDFVDFDWYYQSSPEKVIFIRELEFIGSDETHVFAVLLNEKDHHIWTQEIIPQPGIVDKYFHTWDMVPR